MITLVLGGARSGKSAVAERLAAHVAGGGAVTYVAAAAADPDEAGTAAAMARRPAAWTTVACGPDLVGTLRDRVDPGAVALVDSLGGWLAARPDLAVDPAALVAALDGRRRDTIVVSEEVGLGGHPATEAGRRFRDALGDLNRAVADAADEVLLVVAGRVLPLDRAPGGFE